MQQFHIEGKPIDRPKNNLWENTYIWEIGRGLWVTMKHFFVNLFTRKWTATIQYPEKKVIYPERHRGTHRLLKRKDGSIRCVACFCCQTACPAQCIHIEAAEYPEDSPYKKYEKYPAKFYIDELRCIVCGYCEEACPTDAIRLDTGMHNPPALKRQQLIYYRDLLASHPGRDGTFETSNPRG